MIFFRKYIKIGMRGGEVVSCEAHNLETHVQFVPPQQAILNAGVAQWLEQSLHKAKVVGPIPTTGTLGA